MSVCERGNVGADSESRWHVEDTRRLVQTIFGRKQLDLAAPSLRSSDDQLYFARVQFAAFNQLSAEYLRDRADDENFTMFDLTLGDNDDEWQAFNIFLRKAGAHVTACIWSMHTLPDTMAHAVYYSLGDLIGPPLSKTRDINAVSVVQRLRAMGLQRLAVLLAEMKEGGGFGHLSALSNHAKHRSLIRHALNEDLTGERPQRFEVVLPAFVYEAQAYPQVEVQTFLAPEYERLSRGMIALGKELHAVLQQFAVDRGKT
jgi:hypothetical protein